MRFSQSSLIQFTENSRARFLGAHGVAFSRAALENAPIMPIGRQSLWTECFLRFHCLDVAVQGSYPSRSSKCRSSFSVEQVLQLERVFERQKYLGSRDRQRLADQLHMTETQVR